MKSGFIKTWVGGKKPLTEKDLDEAISDLNNLIDYHIRISELSTKCACGHIFKNANDKYFHMQKCDIPAI